MCYWFGYVGLPICLKISKKYDTVGFDTNNRRISYLKKSIDENKEFKKKDFINKKIFFTNKIHNLKNFNFLNYMCSNSN